MPSIQWGATSTSKLVFTPVSSALGALPNAAGTIAILWKPASTTSGDGVGLTNSADSVWGHTMAVNSSAWSDDDGSVFVHASTGPNATDWYISAVEWPSGTAQTERFHFVDQTTAGAWTHSNATATNGTPPSGPGTSGWLRIGYNGDDGLSSGVQIALVGVWTVALGDTNAALLNTNLRTSDWYKNPAGTPVFLCEVTSLTPTDLIGGSTFSAANSTTTNLTVGSDPGGGWTFDGLGASSSFVPGRMPLGA